LFWISSDEAFFVLRFHKLIFFFEESDDLNILANVTVDSGIVTANSDDRDRGLALRDF
jgi:hypothetical protein